MKKIAVLVTAALLMVSAFVLAGDIGKDDAADVMRKALNEVGFKCNVAVSDIDENGVSDFAIEYVSGHEGEQILMLLAGITGAAGQVIPMLNWQCDKVLVVVNEDVFGATAGGIIKCSTLGDPSEEEITQCLNEIWELVEDN